MAHREAGSEETTEAINHDADSHLLQFLSSLNDLFRSGLACLLHKKAT